MRRFIIAIAACACLASSCVVESYSENWRKASSLMYMATTLFDSEVSDAALLLNSIPDSVKFAKDFSDTVESAFASEIRYKGDSVWVTSSLDKSISITSSTFRMLPDAFSFDSPTSKGKVHFWEVSVTGHYDEGNGYGADFGTEAPILIKWTEEMSYNGIWSLNPGAEGNFSIKTFLNGSSLDKGTMVCKGAKYDFYSNIGDLTGYYLYL